MADHEGSRMQILDEPIEPVKKRANAQKKNPAEPQAPTPSPAPLLDKGNTTTTNTTTTNTTTTNTTNTTNTNTTATTTTTTTTNTTNTANTTNTNTTNTTATTNENPPQGDVAEDDDALSAETEGVQIEPDDPWDPEEWGKLLECVHNPQISPDHVRAVYDRFLELYPTAARYWKLYAQFETQQGNIHLVDEIFKRSLQVCPHVELWRTYLLSVCTRHGAVPTTTTTNPNSNPNPNANANSTTSANTNSTTAKSGGGGGGGVGGIGKDVNIRQLSFTQMSVPQRDSIEKAFIFALDHVGFDLAAANVWLDYISFLTEKPTASQYEENQKNEKIKQVLTRACLIPMIGVEQLWRDFQTFENTFNPTLAKATFADLAPKHQLAKQVLNKRRQIRDGILPELLARPPSRHSSNEITQHALWKRVVHFEMENPQHVSTEELKPRVVLAYKQALMCLYHSPDVWHDACVYLVNSAQHDQASRLFDLALEAVPQSLVMHLSYADFEESRKNYERAKEVYENLVSTKPSPLVYIHYQRFVRRTEGVEAARKIFLKARKDPSANSSYHIFVACALMEYHTNKLEDVARNIFDLGLKQFSSSPEFVHYYLTFLLSLNDHINVRVVFEKVMSSLTAEQSREIMASYMQFEYMCGSLASIHKLERRWVEMLKSEDSMPSVILRRYSCLGLWPCSAKELEAFETPLPAIRTKAGASRDTSRIARPDISRMVVYAPSTSTGAMGGDGMPPPIPHYPPAPSVIPFPIHPQLEEFLVALPPFGGNVPLDIQYVISVLQKLPNLEEFAPEPQHNRRPPKRRHDTGDSSDSEQPKRPAVMQRVDPPGQDLFRERQKQKLKNEFA